MSIERARPNAEPRRSNHWSSGECPVTLDSKFGDGPGTVTRTERAPFQAVTLIEASGLLLVLGLVARAARNHRHF